jgi:hypothetical protein
MKPALELNMKLTDIQLLRIWEMSMDEIQKTIKDPHQTPGMYLAKCWTNGLIRALKKEGKELCFKSLEKD